MWLSVLSTSGATFAKKPAASRRRGNLSQINVAARMTHKLTDIEQLLT